MGKGPRRSQNIVIKSQFNIGGSRGQDVGHFVSDYVARDAATDPSLAYVPPTDRPMEPGDGVAFTLHRTAISRQETLALADRVQEIFARGNRAIEQLVISFAPTYLVEQGVVPEGLSILNKGDYRYQYDDVRLRHSVSAGLHAMLENEGYYHGNFVAAIQSDTLHLHVHAVVYEEGCKFTRFHGREERGLLKESSLNRLAHHIDRYMESTKDLRVVPTQRFLLPTQMESRPLPPTVFGEPDLSMVDKYLRLLEEQEREEALRKLVPEEELASMVAGVLQATEPQL